MSKKRIYSLDVFKLLLAYEIALFHLGIELPPSPAVAVDIFFALSGFFLAKKFYAEDKHDSWGYTLNHVKTVYPHYLFSLGVFFAYQLLRNVVVLVMNPSMQGLWDLGAYFYDQIADLLMLQSSHYFVKSLLYPAWQISAMLIAGYFVYELLAQNEKLARKIILPAAILMVQSLMYAGADYFDNYGFFYLPLLRGFSGIGLGVLTYVFTTTEAVNAVYRRKGAMNIASLLAIAALLLYEDRGRTHLILIPFLIVVCMNPDCWINRALNRRQFAFCGKLSLAIYLNHTFLIRICETQIQPRTGISLNMLGVVYVLLLTVYSIGTMLLVEKLCKKFLKTN